MSEFNRIIDLDTTRIAVQPGATLGVLVTPIPRQNYVDLRVIGGTTLQVLGVTFGVTLGVTALANYEGGGSSAGTFQLNSTDTTPYRIWGPARFYLLAVGATVTVGLARARDGYPENP